MYGWESCCLALLLIEDARGSISAAVLPRHKARPVPNVYADLLLQVVSSIGYWPSVMALAAHGGELYSAPQYISMSLRRGRTFIPEKVLNIHPRVEIIASDKVWSRPYSAEHHQTLVFMLKPWPGSVENPDRVTKDRGLCSAQVLNVSRTM